MLFHSFSPIKPHQAFAKTYIEKSFSALINMSGKTFLKVVMVFALVVLIFNGNPASTRAARLAVMMKSKVEAVEDRSPAHSSMPNPPTYLPAPPGSSSSPPQTVEDDNGEQLNLVVQLALRFFWIKCLFYHLCFSFVAIISQHKM